MSKLTTIIRGMAMACSVMAGAGISLLFMQDLLPMSTQGQPGTLGCYASLFSDSAVSLMAGCLAGWLVHFFLWDCLGNWLGSLGLYIKNRLQPRGGPGPQEAEQAG